MTTMFKLRFMRLMLGMVSAILQTVAFERWETTYQSTAMTLLADFDVAMEAEKEKN